jgi:hypothetical protein
VVKAAYEGLASLRSKKAVETMRGIRISRPA